MHHRTIVELLAEAQLAEIDARQPAYEHSTASTAARRGSMRIFRTLAPQVVSIRLAELYTPRADGLIRDEDATGAQAFLHIAIAEAEYGRAGRTAPLCFPTPPSEPDLHLSAHPALQGSAFRPQRYRWACHPRRVHCRPLMGWLEMHRALSRY